MDSFKKITILGAFLFFGILGASRPSFAQEPKTLAENIEFIYVAPLKATITDIKADIDNTQIQMQKMTDVIQQREAVRDLLVRVSGRISGYTYSKVNLLFAIYGYETTNIPYVLIGAHQIKESPLPWFDLMKDPQNIPEMGSPVTVINTIKKNFSITADASLQIAADIQTKLKIQREHNKKYELSDDKKINF